MSDVSRQSVEDLIQEIINMASDKGTDIDSSLFKARVLAARLDNPELAEWAKHELEGYKKEPEIPSYRHVPTMFRGDMFGVVPGGRVSGVRNIPLGSLPDDIQRLVTSAKLSQSVGSIQTMLNDNTDRSPRLPLDPSIIPVIQPLVPGMEVAKIFQEIAPASLEGLLTTVRSRLLDLVLALDAKFGDELPKRLSELSETTKRDVARVVQLTINGDNNAIAIDSESTVQSIEVREGNWEVLERELERLSVPAAQREALRTNKDGALQWLKRMNKSVWASAGSTAVQELTKAVLGYFGVPR